jgi:osmoprotectant transport system permease protein
LTAHLSLTLFPLLLGTVLSVPLGVLSSRSRSLEHLVLNVGAVVQTVPSLALLALMVPLLGAIGATSIGYAPAFVALTLYSMLPVLRNTVTALSGIDATLIEAARGVGMSPRERLLHVELPLAAPVIVAGIRTSAVWTVGAATLATPVGADSLGNYIFSGLQTRNASAVLVGCAACAALALSLDGLGRALLAGVTRRSRRITFTAAAAFAALYLYSGASLAIRAGAGQRDAITRS